MASVRAEPAVPHGTPIRAHLVRLVLAVALPLAALVAWHLYERAQADLQNARQQVFHLAQVTASETTRFLGQTQNILNGLAARPAVRALDASRCDPILKEFLGLAPRFSNIVTVAIDGRVVCSAVPLAGITRVDPDILLNRLRGPDQLTVGKITPGAITGRWAVPIARPLLDAQGGVAGTVSLSVDLMKLAILPSVKGLPAEASTGVIDLDGTVLARALHPERFVGTNQGNREGTRKLLTEKSGVDEEISIDGILRVRAFTPIPGTDWIAVASVPASAVYAGARARIAASALIAIAIVFAVLLFAFRLGRQIHGPIAAIADTADEVAAGNLAVRAPLAGAAEIVHVSAQFNEMLDKRARAEADLRESEARFRSLTELSSDYYWEQDEQLRFIARVGSAYERDAIPLEEIIGKKRWELPGHNLTEEDWQRHRADLDARREFRDLEIMRPGVSGAPCWISSSGRPIVDADGRFRGYRGIGRDITARKFAEQALRESVAGLRQAQKIAKLAHGVTRADGSFESWPETLPGMVGMEPARMPTSTREWLTILHPDDRAMFREESIRTAKSRTRFDLQYRLRRGDGTWINIRHVAEPLRASPGGADATRWFCTLQDVTESKRVEDALRQSESMYRDLFMNLPVPVYVAHFDTLRIVDANAAAERFYGYSRDELCGIALRELRAPENRIEFDQMVRAFDTASPRHIEVISTRHRTRRGEVRDVDVHLYFENRDGFRSGTSVIVDQTERKRTDATLRESEAGLRQAQLLAKLAYAITRSDSVIESPSEAMAMLIGVVPGRVPKSVREWLTLLHPEDRALFRDKAIEAAKRGTRWDIEYRLRRGDGAWVEFRHVIEPLPGAADAAGGARWFNMVQDITEQKRADAALRESGARLEALTRRLLEAQESERRSIARELHDEVGGVLTAVKLNLQSLRPRRGDAGGAALADSLALVDGAIQSVRSLSLDLRPAVLDDLGLIPALKWYCERQAKRADVAIELALEAIDLRAAPQLESGCFRIVQEAVTNALRHAKARRIRVSLRRGDGSFALEVADDGTGFDAAAARKRALAGESSGLLGMAERAALLGGRFDIDSVAGAGTTVRAEFAVPASGFA